MKAGDYVRTKYGDIFKYIKTDEDGKLRRTLNSDNENITTGFELSDVTKSSPNIIDLIKEGDYVNGSKVEWVGNDFIAFGRLDYAYEKDIKSIVTKEKFESMEYKVVD